MTPDPLPELGALRLWRRELAAGVRTTAETDVIWRAACAEASANDFLALGVPFIANRERLRAAHLLVTAAAEVVR